ncbi:MAG: hypothetical protein QE271_13175 [Bacteriovoracaceae bacterium]|nr:hypothetical protein [Bacteriovoracaceae bacterium]
MATTSNSTTTTTNAPTVKATAQSKASMLKAFRATSDVENFYRFIHENSLRHEAKVLLEKVLEKVKKSGGYNKKKSVN